jgi:ribonuclease R
MKGRISVHPRGFGFVTSEASGGASETSAFVPPPELNKFLTDDVVTCELETKDGRHTARAITLVHRPRTRLFGEVMRRGDRRFLRTDRVVANTDWALTGDAPDGAVIVARIDGDRCAVVHEVPAAQQETERLLCRHDLRGDHDAALLDAARTAPALPALISREGGHRRDLRAHVCVTIDGPSTKDIDDALLALPPDEDGGLRVIVAIADVGSVVEEGGALDRDARERATSVYLPGRVVPMLPRALSEESLSLLPGAERLALTAELRIDPEGRVTSVDLHEAIIRSTGRLTYDAVAEFLEHDRKDSVPAETHDTLRLLRAASARLSQARAERGGRDVEREEIALQLDDAGSPEGLELKRGNCAHVLVERLMVAANEAVAHWLVERGLPGVYRVHDAPTLERTRALEETLRSLGLVAGFSTRSPLSPRALRALDRQVEESPHASSVELALRRLLGPARYTQTPSPHFGLAAPLYLHFTSPIRRYADLLVHRVVRAYLRGARAAPLDAAALEATCVHINDATHRAARAEAERERVLVARLFGKRIGETVRAVVVGHKPQGSLLQLGGALAMLPGEALPLGAALDVVVASVDEELGRIDVKLS